MKGAGCIAGGSPGHPVQMPDREQLCAARCDSTQFFHLGIGELRQVVLTEHANEVSTRFLGNEMLCELGQFGAA